MDETRLDEKQLELTTPNRGPLCASDLEARRFQDRVIVTCGGLVHLSLTLDEFDFLKSLDGRTNVDDLDPRYRPESSDLLADFRLAGLLEGSEAPDEERFAVTESGIEFGGFDRLVAAIHRSGVRYLLRPSALAIASVVTVAGLVSLVVGGSRFGQTQALEFDAAGTLLLFSIFGFTLAVVHESAHALVTHHYGRRVGRAGFCLYWGSLTFFVDSTDALLLPRRHRVLQAVAGPAVDAVVAAVLTLTAIWVVGPGDWGTLLFRLAVLVWLDVLMNLAPLLELDGYWALSDALDEPHLRSDSLTAIRRMTAGDWSRSTLGLAAYGVASVAFGIGAVGVVVWAWIYIYVPMVGAALGQGLLGIVSVAVFVGPVAAGAIVAAKAPTLTVVRAVAFSGPRASILHRESEGGERR